MSCMRCIRRVLRPWSLSALSFASLACETQIAREQPEPAATADGAPHAAHSMNIEAGSNTDAGAFGSVGLDSFELDSGARPHAQAPDWAEPISAPLAIDESDEPNIFETRIEARTKAIEVIAGKSTEVWTYNGSVSGPEIRVKRGDRVIVHFTNSLPEPTTIHWHGLRIPNGMDGVPSVSQPEVQPGETFTYDFVAPDAGTFWYHPHVRSAAQAGFGLYGSFVVTDPDETPGLGDELTLALSDMSLDEDGNLQPADVSGDLGTLFGREGSHVLVNGKLNPAIDVRAGRRQRWRVVNAARSRYFQLGVAGHTFTRIGGDSGFIERPVVENTVIVAPGERSEVVFEPLAPAETELAVQWIPYEHGFGSTFGRPEVTVFRLRVTTEEPYVEEPLPPLTREIPPLEVAGARVVAMALTQNDAVDGSLALGINGVPSWDAEPIVATIGETQIWEVSNTIDFAHPFHLHGFFFQVLELNGVAPTVREWKDTANVPVDGVLKLAVHFDERPGMWMFHCHILDHADAGMMGMVSLREPGDTAHPPDAGMLHMH